MIKIEYDPRQQKLYENDVTVYRSSDYVNVSTFTSNSLSNRNICLNLQMPSKICLLDRFIYQTITTEFYFNLDDDNKDLIDSFKLKKLPLNHCIQNSSIYINGCNISETTNDVIDFLLSSNKTLNEFDNNATYELVNLGDNKYKIVAEWYEPIVCGLFAYSNFEASQMKALTGINIIQITYTLGSLTDLIDISNQLVIDNIQLTKCDFHAKIITPNFKDTKPPIEVIYDITSYYVFKKDFKNNNNVIHSDSLQLCMKPNIIGVVIKDTETNEIASIDRCSVSFNNIIGLLSSCNKYDLWNMSREYNLLDDYTTFQKSSILIIGNTYLSNIEGDNTTNLSIQCDLKTKGLYKMSIIIKNDMLLIVRPDCTRLTHKDRYTPYTAPPTPTLNLAKVFSNGETNVSKIINKEKVTLDDHPDTFVHPKLRKYNCYMCKEPISYRTAVNNSGLCDKDAEHSKSSDDEDTEDTEEILCLNCDNKLTKEDSDCICHECQEEENEEKDEEEKQKSSQEHGYT